MKIHITNLYNFNKNDSLVTKHHQFANAGRALGYLEMSIFNYPVESDTENELSKRLDGIIAGIESDDFVFMQLPTNNGYNYEKLLFNKIKAYKNTKIVIILHNMNVFFDSSDNKLQAQYHQLFKSADAIIAPTASALNMLKNCGLTNLLFCDNILVANQISVTNTDYTNCDGYISLCQSDFYIKKLLMDAVATVFTPQQQLMQSATPVMDDEIHIGFGLYDKTGNYSVWVGVTMQSIIEHTNSKICFHILHDSTLNDDNKHRLMQVAVDYGHRILFHYLDDTLFSTVAKQVRGYTIGTMFRVMLPELLPSLSRIIYLDADLLVNRDIQELWDTDISDYCLAAVPDADVANHKVLPIPVERGDVHPSQYFNAGVIYMNLDRIREKGNMRNDILSYLAKTKESTLPDQDALNTIYADSIKLLDGSWNYFARNVHIKDERKLEQKIYHYVGTGPAFYYHTEMDELYFMTTSRTPWGIEQCKAQLRQAMIRTTDRIEQFEHLVRQISVPNIKRIFYGEENFAMRNIYQLVSIQEGDYRILSQPKNQHNSILPCKSISALADEKEPYIVLVLPEADDWHAIENLEQLGLKNGIDFIVARRLLSLYDGGYS